MKQPKSASLNLTTLSSEADASNFSSHMKKSADQEAGKETDESASAPAIDDKVQRHIGRKLKASYEELIKQPVPEKFRNLLEELQRKEKKQ
jgi:Anti-sigma factor NepR